jgi:hypothetical protein
MKEKTEKFDEACPEQTKKKHGEMQREDEAFPRTRESISRKRQKDAVLAKLEMQSKKSAATKAEREAEGLKQKKQEAPNQKDERLGKMEQDKADSLNRMVKSQASLHPEKPSLMEEMTGITHPTAGTDDAEPRQPAVGLDLDFDGVDEKAKERQRNRAALETEETEETEENEEQPLQPKTKPVVEPVIEDDFVEVNEAEVSEAERN